MRLPPLALALIVGTLASAEAQVRAESGLCGEAAFPGASACGLNGSGSTVTCK